MNRDKKALEVEGLSVALGERKVLENIAFSVTEGERVVLVGANGAGKTTLLKVLCGLISPVNGTVRFFGRDVSQDSLNDKYFYRDFRSQMGLLFQNVDAMLFNPSVRDEIAFGPRQVGMRDVQERVHHYSRMWEIEGLLERPPFELSGGEKKRVAIASLLAVEPRVLLLDEPTAGLDPPGAALLVQILGLLDGVTVLASTHNLSVAPELGRRALLLAPDGSSLRYDGPVDGLLRDEDLLSQSGLGHRHLHGHEGGFHSHFHIHDLD